MFDGATCPALAKAARWPSVKSARRSVAHPLRAQPENRIGARFTQKYRPRIHAGLQDHASAPVVTEFGPEAAQTMGWHDAKALSNHSFADGATQTSGSGGGLRPVASPDITKRQITCKTLIYSVYLIWELLDASRRTVSLGDRSAEVNFYSHAEAGKTSVAREACREPRSRPTRRWQRPVPVRVWRLWAVAGKRKELRLGSANLD